MLTRGQFRTEVPFNPSGRAEVDSVKELGAQFIDFLDELKEHATDTEQQRCADIAAQKAEEAVMFAVKAITMEPRHPDSVPEVEVRQLRVNAQTRRIG